TGATSSRRESAISHTPTPSTPRITSASRPSATGSHHGPDGGSPGTHGPSSARVYGCRGGGTGARPNHRGALTAAPGAGAATVSPAGPPGVAPGGPPARPPAGTGTVSSTAAGAATVSSTGPPCGIAAVSSTGGCRGTSDAVAGSVVAARSSACAAAGSP